MDFRKCRSKLDPAWLLLGSALLIGGIGIGRLMYMDPGGLNPEWPLWMAMVVPVLFSVSGLFMIGSGLGLRRFAGAMIRLILFCFLAIGNWVAFFTTRFKASVSIAFLGFPIAEGQLSQPMARTSLKIIMACVDALFIIPSIYFVWQKLQKSRPEPSK